MNKRLTNKLKFFLVSFLCLFSLSFFSLPVFSFQKPDTSIIDNSSLDKNKQTGSSSCWEVTGWAPERGYLGQTAMLQTVSCSTTPSDHGWTKISVSYGKKVPPNLFLLISLKDYHVEKMVFSPLLFFNGSEKNGNPSIITDGSLCENCSDETPLELFPPNNKGNFNKKSKGGNKNEELWGKKTQTKNCGANAVYVGPNKAKEYGGVCLHYSKGVFEIHASYTMEKDCSLNSVYVGPNKPEIHGGYCLRLKNRKLRSSFTKNKVCEQGGVYAGPNKPEQLGGYCVYIVE
ncbi:MAG: hypothetical protein KAH20_07475 [Methylococcales bacterium]|nr:hypothetical protein [Methylococcales bacterium]